MAWNLKITPNGLLLSKYAKNIIMVNPDNVDGVERQYLLNDVYQKFNTNNLIDLEFQLSIFNIDPLNTEPQPEITRINYIQISNDPSFREVFTLTPSNFSSFYNSNTDYYIDLSTYDISTTSMPFAGSGSFTESPNGRGRIVLNNWTLSGSSGLKRVYISINVALSNGDNIVYPDGLNIYDEITVCSYESASPSIPEALASSGEYASLPLYFKSLSSSNFSIEDKDDDGVAAYFWDAFALKSNTNLARENYSPSNLNLFKSASPSLNNTEDFPLFLRQTSTVSSWSPSDYRSYQSTNAFQISQNNNIYLFEVNVNNKDCVYNYVNGNNIYYEFNVVNSDASVKHLRIQLVIDISLQNMRVVTSIDDSSWSSDTSYVPAADYTESIISDVDIISKIINQGIFLLVVQPLNYNDVFQYKLTFTPQDKKNSFILAEGIFQSTTLDILTDIYGETRFFIQNAVYEIILESLQYGVCLGTVSAASLPKNKIQTNELLPLQNTANEYYSSLNLNTWQLITNSKSSGVIGNNESELPSLQFFNNQEVYNPSTNTSVVELQSSIPTFSEENTFGISFNLPSSFDTITKLGYSLNNNLDFDDFTFNDLLSTSSGAILPQPKGKYNFSSRIEWDSASVFGLNVEDQGFGQTCSLSTTSTTRLFLYSQPNNTGNFTSPEIISTKSGVSTTNTFKTWIVNNGYDTSEIVSNFAVINNYGLSPISISTGVGLNTVIPGQTFIYSGLSYDANTPTQFIVSTNDEIVDNSLNFLYDFGQNGTIGSVSLSAQIAEPPYCPITLPSIQYSLEVSSDFIVWTNASATSSITFEPSTGDMNLLFDDINLNGRYVRLRLYYNASVVFNPRSQRRYSSLAGTIESVSETNTQGKLYFGFTDTNAKEASLGSLYNQPTYIRSLYDSNTQFYGILIDFVNFNTDVMGPVYFSLLTDQGNIQFFTLQSGFNYGTNYNVSLTIQRTEEGQAYKLQPSVLISDSTSIYFNQQIDAFISPANSYNDLVYGCYPFVSLVGNGMFNVVSSIIQGTYNHGLDQNNNTVYFAFSNPEKPHYSAEYGKHILRQNSFSITKYQWNEINSLFYLNRTKVFSYDNITFECRAAATHPVSLYGEYGLDGVYLESCDYVLVSGQSDASTNGVYQVQKQQWVKMNPNPSSSGLPEPTVLVTEGNVFSDTLWMLDISSQNWICNTIACPFVLDDQQLLTDSIYKYPQYIKVASGVSGTQNVDSLDQVKIKLINSPDALIEETNSFTQWNSLLQNGILYSDFTKSSSNNTVFLNFGISTAQLNGISTFSFPATYNLVVSYAGNYTPAASKDAQFVLPEYGTPYRMLNNAHLNFQLFSSCDVLNVGSLNTSVVNVSAYALSIADVKSLQSGFSSSIIVDSQSPSVGILSAIQDNVKSVVLGISTVQDSASGLSIARVVQKTPANNTVYGSWFGYNNNSFSGISSVMARPTYVSNTLGVTTGSPLSGYYQYSLQIADAVGNITETNPVESFYYETALIDTQGPSASVSFVNDNSQPISITSSTVLTAQLFAQDSVSQVKAFRYKILPDGEYGSWMDYNEYTDIYLPEEVVDGSLSIQFQFKDYGNNVLYSNTTISGNEVFVYTWNIVSRLLSGVLFTVTESTTFNNQQVLLIGASKSGAATIYIWNSSKLFELQFPLLASSSAVTSLISVGDVVVIGTNDGKIFHYQNGVVTGPFAQLKIGDEALTISSFLLHKYQEENDYYVYASTINTPRIFRTPVDGLKNLSWELIQTNPISLSAINVLNSGLWSGNSVYYQTNSQAQEPIFSSTLSYGISSVIVVNSGSNITSSPSISVSGPIEELGLQPVMQGYILKLNLLSTGLGYTSGATVNIEAPVAGGTQATGYAVTNSVGKIVAIGLSPGGQGYGYTSANPTVTITGNLGFGSQAVVSATTQYDSIYSVDVISSGYSTTKDISFSVPNGAILVPDFLYRVASIEASSPGFGFTSAPLVSINGITSLAYSTINGGSIESIVVTDSEYEFEDNGAPTIETIGGFGTNWVGTISTSAIVFSVGTAKYNGSIISSINISESGYGFGTQPTISFTTSTSELLFEPELEYVYSDNPVLFSSSGSIYDIEAYNDKIFAASTDGVIEIGLSSGIFSANKIPINISPSDYNDLVPTKLASYYNGLTTGLYFSSEDEPYVGLIQYAYSDNVFNAFLDNSLLYKPYNFDVLSNWQLTKIFNNNGIGTVSQINDSVLISTENSFIFYESTKDNTWANRCLTNNDYLVQFSFSASSGTQGFEISTYNSTLKGTFTVLEDSVRLCFGNKFYQSISIALKDSYNISYVKTGNKLFIYNSDVLIYQQSDFYTEISSNPIIKFGCIFEPLSLTINSSVLNVFGAPAVSLPSQFYWKQIKLSFNTSEQLSNVLYYNVNVPYSLPNTRSVRVLKNLNGNLFVATRALNDTRQSSIYSDLTTKVHRLTNNIWEDVTGQFETYTGVSTSYVISSPNDIGVLGNSYFVTGIVQQIEQRSSSTSITLGLSSSFIYEESEGNYLIVIYPYSPNPSGSSVQLSNNNGLISVPSSVHFDNQNIIEIIPIGIAATSLSSSTIITATDGINTSTITAFVIPIGISSLGLSTNLFTGYSQDSVVATLSLNSIPTTPRTITLSSDNSGLLNTQTGIVTVQGTIGFTTTLLVGSPVSANTNVAISANYRGTSGIATATAAPFEMTLGLSTGIFVGNELYRNVDALIAINKTPIGVLTANLKSNTPLVLSAPFTNYISPGSFSTSPRLSIGSAVTGNTPISITASIGGLISTGIATARPYYVIDRTFTINGQTNNRPILGFQTVEVTYTLNTSPQNNLVVYNIITQPDSVALNYVNPVTVLAGAATTTYSLSTTLTTAAGLAITVQGAPLGYNTSALATDLITDIWRVTNFTVSPTSIVGGGGNANGTAQAFALNVTMNLGVSTTIAVVSNTGFVHVNPITFNETSIGSVSTVGYATGFTTSIITDVSLSVQGPSGVSSSVTGLLLNPFLISSLSTSYIWNGVQTTRPNYLIGGIGATAVATATLNAYSIGGIQTVAFSANSPLVYTPGLSVLGIGTVQPGQNTASINIGAAITASGTSIIVSGQIISSSLGYATNVLNVYPQPSIETIFYPIFSGNQNKVFVVPEYVLPVGITALISFSDGTSGSINLPANNPTASKFFSVGSFGFDTTLTATSIVLGVSKTYFVTGYAHVSGVFGVGYNYYGELSYRYPVIGPLSGSASKVYMGLPNAVKSASGYHHNIALDNLGKVYTIGLNTDYQLGFDGISTSSFRQVTLPTNYISRDIYAQRNTSYVITADNKLYSFGGNNDNALGFTGVSTFSPKLVGNDVYLFATFDDVAAYVSSDSATGIQTVYEFGGGLAGTTAKVINQLSLNGTPRNISNLKITNIDVNEGHKVASGVWDDVTTGVSSSGVFAWGFNTNYQTGSITTTGYSNIPNILSIENVYGITSSAPHTNLISANDGYTLIGGSYVPINEYYVDSVEVISLGIGYTLGAVVTFSSPQMTISSQIATGIAVTNNLGYVYNVSISNGGAGYTVGAAVTFSPPPAGLNTSTATGIVTVIADVVSSIYLTSPGFGYTVAPDVYITASNGSGAQGVATLIQGQIESIIVVNSGFGYTSTPTITVTGTSNIGSGATGTAILGTNISSINTISIVGLSSKESTPGYFITTNSSIGISSIGKTSWAGGTGREIYKLSKNANHYVFVEKTGNMYISGQTANDMSSGGKTTVTKYYLYCQNNAVLNYSEAYSSVFKLQQPNLPYGLSLFGQVFPIGFSLPTKYIVQPPKYYGTTLINDNGGFGMSITGINIEIFYYDLISGGSEQWNLDSYVVYMTSSIFGDIGMKQLDTEGRDSREFNTQFYYSVNDPISSTTAVNILTGITSSSYSEQSIDFNPTSIYISKPNSTKLDAFYIKNYRGSTFNVDEITYDWKYSDYCFAIGFEDGTVQLYGNAYSDDVEGGINLISSWNPDGSAITCLKSVNDITHPNESYLFVGTESGYLYCYEANGDKFNTYNQTILESTQSPNLINESYFERFRGWDIYGYATDVQIYAAGTIIVSTSENYVLILNINDFTVLNTVLYPGTLNSITATLLPANVISQPNTGSMSLFASLVGGSTFNNYNANRQDYEIGLNYENLGGEYQTITIDGSVNGTASTSIVNSSTSDTFTLILDSSRPTG